MVRQTTKRIALYARRDSPGEPPPINVDPIPVKDGTPTDGELREAVKNGRTGGPSGMRAEDVKAWLRGIQLEEDPKDELANVDKGDNWRLFTKLAQAVLHFC